MDWERHERELADLRCGERIAERVLSDVHRRTTRRVMVLAGCAVAVVIAAGVPVAVELARSDRSAAPAGSSGPAPAPAVSEPEPVAEIYAAALQHSFALSDVASRRAQVRASTCSAVSDPTRSGCGRSAPIPAKVQDDVLAALPAAARISFAPAPTSTPPGSAAVPFVTFGAVEIDGHHARVFVQVWGGFDNLSGNGLRLTLRDGTWRFAGLYGKSYIT